MQREELSDDRAMDLAEPDPILVVRQPCLSARSYFRALPYPIVIALVRRWLVTCIERVRCYDVAR